MLILLKLQNGQEVIGNVKEEVDNLLTIEDPLQINYRLVATQPMPTVSVSRYMPFASEKVFVFHKKDLLHVAAPKAAMADYYIHALNNYREQIDGVVEDELIGASRPPEGLDEMDEEQMNEAYKALLERMNLKGPLN